MHTRTPDILGTEDRHSRGTITVISDSICPWCYVGKRKLDAALAILSADGLKADVEWKPFLLNPDMPAGGADRRGYRSAKFGSWARSQALDHQVATAGAAFGLAFNHELMERTPNTTLSHVLIALAYQEGGSWLQDKIVEALFAAYFTNGRDVGDADVLATIASEVGMDRAFTLKALANPDRADFIRVEDAAAKQLGIRGVPAFAAGGRVLASGAQDPATLAKLLSRSLASGADADLQQADIVA